MVSAFRFAIFFVCVTCPLCWKPVLASLVVDLVGGAVLMEGEVSMGAPSLDLVATINTASTFRGHFYGSPVGRISVIDNGHLNFSGNVDIFTDVRRDGIARIAPLWDDILMIPGTNNRVVDHSIPGQYLGITWSNVRLFNELVAGPPFPDTDRSFQVLWFEAPTTIKGVNFNAHEIVFSYVGNQAGTSNFGPIFATTGITDGFDRFTPLPGDADGYITATQSSLLAWEPNAYLIFRPVVTGNVTNYVSSKEFFTAVPEPSTITLIAAVLCGASGMLERSRQRRRKRSVHTG